VNVYAACVTQDAARTVLRVPTSPEPFLRWAGGKRQLLPLLLPALPADFELGKHRFFEPFMGGAALTWALSGSASGKALKPARRKKGLPIVLNDVNDELVNTYQVVRDDVDALIVALTDIGVDTSSARYYAVRDSVETDRVARAARTIYLNRLSFNGLYRVRGSDGKFNVPYGKVAKPTVCDAELLRACSLWLANVELRSGSYVAAVNDAKEGDVVYFDPPYVPLSTTSSFSKYAKDDFREMDQWGLAGVIRGLAARGVRVMLSNSNAPLTRQIFGDDLHLFAVAATRSIGASAASRRSVEEVIGVSYQAADTADWSKLEHLRALSPERAATT
jgi:DNA adenine methylase